MKMILIKEESSVLVKSRVIDDEDTEDEDDMPNGTNPEERST